VRASTVGPADCAFRKGDPLLVRFFVGLLRPKTLPGSDFAGEVVSVGRDVSLFAVGDRVFGSIAPESGAHAEYMCVPEDGVIANMPDGLDYEQAAAFLDGGLTALPFLRDHASLGPGQEILINGASGSVGGAAVQLAKYFGAVVTGVCSAENVERVKSLGADHVIDYTRVDFTKADERYGVVFDAVGTSSFSRCKDALKSDGIYLTTVPSLGIMFQSLKTRLVGKKRAKIAFTGLSTNRERLAFLEARLAAGDLRPVIDRRYSIEEIAEAHRYVDTQRKKGSVVLTI
jgi:NADPH:quinone reductase-like Zn-dependent oxidoreductase